MTIDFTNEELELLSNSLLDNMARVNRLIELIPMGLSTKELKEHKEKLHSLLVKINKD